MPDRPPFLYLDEADLSRLPIHTDEVVESLEHLVRREGEASLWTPSKTSVTLPDGRYLMAGVAAVDDPPVMAVKSLVLNPANPDRGLPQINATVTVLDSNTGLPLAVMDGNWITAVRTAGLSALAASRLANPDASSIAFIGCGVQARAHLRAFADRFPLAEMRAFGRGAANRDTLCAAGEERGLRAVASATGQDAIEGADLVVTTVTLSTDTPPFLDARGMKPGSFAAVTDFVAPWLRESLGAFDRIVTDDLAQPLIEPDLFDGDLHAVLAGEIPGRQDATERTAFIFRGPSVADLALAALVYRKAREAGAGTPVHATPGHPPVRPPPTTPAT